jgi:hypothetical protein
MKRVRPDLIGEFRDKIILVQQKKPLAGPANGVLQQMFNEALVVLLHSPKAVPARRPSLGKITITSRTQSR